MSRKSSWRGEGGRHQLFDEDVNKNNPEVNKYYLPPKVPNIKCREKKKNAVGYGGK